ncbi:MAG: dihydrofolate reductase family protein [Pseudomonadota bacterium]
MPASWFIEGHAIVSAEGCIADAEGRFPEALRNAADWRRFQAALDRAAAVVMGRASHEATPNRAGRLRVVLSSRAEGLARREDAWWWNPAQVPVARMLATVAPEGGVIAVPGGREVFDLFLAHGFDAFHLARNPGARLPGGTPVFSGVGQGRTPEDVLRAAGLGPGPEETLDPQAGVTVAVWRRPEKRNDFEETP